MIPVSEEECYYKLDNMVLSSTQFLRKVLKRRYKAETEQEWVDDQPHIQDFFQGPGKTAYKKAQISQKAVLDKSESMEDWDMTLLSALIQNFGEETTYEGENGAVKKLKTLRNDLAHNNTKKIPAGEYTESVAQFRESMAVIGMPTEDITKIIDKAGVTSSVKAWDFVKGLHAQAETQEGRGEWQKAEDLFSEATGVPSLLPANRGITFEKRAQHFLRRVQDPVEDLRFWENALLDVATALELNDCSWMAHYLGAQCYRGKNELGQAISHYERGLAISPAQNPVKRDLDTCKVLAGVHSRQEHPNPAVMPKNLEEKLNQLEDPTGIKLTRGGAKGQDHVGRGHAHRLGWDVPQSFTEAVKYYSKAASVKNPEGMYNLAQCNHYGQGVEQNVAEALRIYREVAEMDPNLPGERTPHHKNLGVAAAQNSIGDMYETGVGVGQDYSEAAKWYHRAMENGMGGAAHNLGILYDQGQGVPRDPKMAEFCWKQGVNLKDIKAPAALVGYYLQQKEPDKAAAMLKTGREMGNDTLQHLSDADFQQQVWYIQQERQSVEPEVVEFERKHNLDSKGLHFQQRLTRCLGYHDQNVTNVEKALGTCSLGEGQATEGGPLEEGGFSQEIISALEKRVAEGSITAIRVMSTVDHCVQLNKLLQARQEFDGPQKMEVVQVLYHIATLEFLHLHLNSEAAKKKLKSIVGSLFDDKCDRKGEEDMKIRLCYASFNLRGTMETDDNYGVEILLQGVRRYPENGHYYKTLVSFLGSKQKFKLGVKYAQQGLEVCPEDPDLLYMYAVQFEESEKDHGRDEEECIVNYKQFIAKAPNDHRMVPEAFYRLSRLYFGKGDSRGLMEAHFKRGEQAELQQLPCYLPYGPSEVKRSVSAILNAGDSGQRQQSNATPTWESPPVKTPVGEESVLDRKKYLQNPGRKATVLKHREDLKKRTEGAGMKVAPKLKQMMARRMTAVKSITLQEMNPREDSIYENRVLDLTLIEDPNYHSTTVDLLGEDENGDVIRVFIYNVDKKKSTLENFQAGSRVAIVNPYLRVGVKDNTCEIRNDEPKCLLFLEKVTDMCRFCGEENAAQKCSQCKRPYCSKECQLLDWKELKHKLVCSVKW